jgi:release factor glutamine methyltransferase
MSPPRTIQSIRESIKKELGGLYPEREIDSLTWILCQYRLDLKRHEISLRKHEILMPPDREWFEKAISKLKSGIPVQHITGETQFFDLNLKVGPQALIPRPETEELVQWILEDHTGAPERIWDIGTGTGCIALALSSKLPGSRIYASDVSEPALELAMENARNLKLEVEFFRHDIMEEEPPVKLAGMDLIVSNPPYIPLREKKGMDPNVRDHDPHEALFVPDDDPLIYYSHIANREKSILPKGGRLYLEIHENFAAGVSSLLEKRGYGEINIKKDINGKDRMVRARRS